MNVHECPFLGQLQFLTYLDHIIRIRIQIQDHVFYFPNYERRYFPFFCKKKWTEVCAVVSALLVLHVVFFYTTIHYNNNTPHILFSRFGANHECDGRTDRQNCCSTTPLACNALVICNRSNHCFLVLWKEVTNRSPVQRVGLRRRRLAQNNRRATVHNKGEIHRTK